MANSAVDQHQGLHEQLHTQVVHCSPAHQPLESGPCPYALKSLLWQLVSRLSPLSPF